jgi:phosphatidylethanolamine-binding protein (PEBP) family uncharacterized protein
MVRFGSRSALAASIVLAAGAWLTAPASTQTPGFAIEYSWKGVSRCSDRSPAIQLMNVPAGTKALDVQMIDLDVPNFKHGGGKVAFGGEAEIAAGAVRYTGPCPPSGQRHTYRFRVTALDDAGKALASADKAQEFPPR